MPTFASCCDLASSGAFCPLANWENAGDFGSVLGVSGLKRKRRESEGVKAVQGDAMLCEKRFAPDTRYMVEFLVLKQTEKFEEAGIYHRYFLTKKAYYEMIELQSQGILRFQRQALVLEGTLHYLPVQTFFRDQE